MYLVTLTRSGPEWDRSKPAEEQAGWGAHAAFMDDLVERGVIILGGPLGDEHRVMLVVDAISAETVHAVLANDPWSDSHLHVDAVEHWTIRLNGLRRT